MLEQEGAEAEYWNNVKTFFPIHLKILHDVIVLEVDS